MTGTTPTLGPLGARLAETAPGLRVETGPGATGPYAHDASNCRMLPRAVAYPRSADDVVAGLRACREAAVPVTARGGGTSMSGNTRPAAQARRAQGRRARGLLRTRRELGFEEQHYDTSMAVAGRALKLRLEGLDESTPTVVVADGFCCATQIDHLVGDRGVRALHLAELLDPTADRPGEPS